MFKECHTLLGMSEASTKRVVFTPSFWVRYRSAKTERLASVAPKQPSLLGRMNPGYPIIASVVRASKAKPPSEFVDIDPLAESPDRDPAPVALGAILDRAHVFKPMFLADCEQVLHV